MIGLFVRPMLAATLGHAAWSSNGSKTRYLCILGPVYFSGIMSIPSILGQVLWKNDNYGCFHFGFAKDSRRNTFTCDFNTFFDCEAQDSRHWHNCTEVAIEEVQFIHCIPTLTFSSKTSEKGMKQFDIRLDDVDESLEIGPTVTRFQRDSATNQSVSICQKFGSDWMQDVR